MNYKVSLMVVALLCLVTYAIVSKIKPTKTETAIAGEASRNGSDAKIPGNEESLTDAEKNFTALGNSSQGTTKIAPDGSQIKTTYDGFGNKTEFRVFNNHPRLKYLMLRTSVTGEKQVYVHGQNGEVEGLPVNMLDKATTVSADEIASSAGITQTRQESITPTYAQTYQPQPAVPLQPLPDSQLPIQIQPAEQALTEEPKETAPKVAASDKTNPTITENIPPKQSKEANVSKRSPDEKQ